MPDAFLDSLVTDESGSEWQYFLSTFGDHDPHPLHHIAIERLLVWAAQAPAERFKILAENALLWQDENGRVDDDAQQSLRWMPLASQLLDATPDKDAILNIYYERFSPSSWSGSLAPLLESRLTLLQQMRDWNSQEAKAFAKTALPLLQRRVEAEYVKEQDFYRPMFDQFDY